MKGYDGVNEEIQKAYSGRLTAEVLELAVSMGALGVGLRLLSSAGADTMRMYNDHVHAVLNTLNSAQPPADIKIFAEATGMAIELFAEDFTEIAGTVTAMMNSPSVGGLR